MAAYNLLSSVLQSLRPYWWGKTFFFFALGAVAAVQTLPALSSLLYGFFLVGPLFSGALYLLNDYSDRKVDVFNPEKKPFARGKISPRASFFFALFLLAGAFLLGVRVNSLFFFTLGLMLLNQLLYSFPPLRLKERAFFDVFSTAVVSSSLKFLAGWFLFTSSFPPPALPLLAISFTQVGSYLVYKWKSNRILDLQLQCRSTVALLSEKTLKNLALVFFILGFAVFVFLSLIPLSFPSLSFLGWLPTSSLVPLGLCIFLAPSYWKQFFQEKGVFKVQATMYRYYYLFTVVLLFLYSGGH